VRHRGNANRRNGGEQDRERQHRADPTSHLPVRPGGAATFERRAERALTPGCCTSSLGNGNNDVL